jgi:cell shape-determining protein MreC
VRDTRRTRVVLAALVSVALILILVSYADSANPVLRHVRSATGSVFGGAEHVASSVGHFFSRSGSSTSQTGSLQRQVLQLRAELSQARVSKAEYAQLPASSVTVCWSPWPTPITLAAMTLA